MTRILRLIKEGFLGVFRHFALAFSSMSSMAVTLVLMSIFMILNQNINQITHQIEQNVSLYVQIMDEVHEDDIEPLQKEISAISGISEVTFSSKHDELEFFIENRGEEGEELFGGFRGDDNPFLNTFIINLRTGSDIKKVAEQISENEEIYSVSYGGEATQTLLDVMENIRNVGFIFVVVLGGVAVFLIANTIGATINSRNEEISIMRTVGATNWYIRWPFVIEGMIIGLLGSVVPVLLTIFGYSKFYELQNASLGGMFKLVPAEPLVWEVVGILVLTGAVVGALGSLITVSRRLRWTR